MPRFTSTLTDGWAVAIAGIAPSSAARQSFPVFMCRYRSKPQATRTHDHPMIISAVDVRRRHDGAGCPAGPRRRSGIARLGIAVGLAPALGDLTVRVADGPVAECADRDVHRADLRLAMECKLGISRLERLAQRRQRH